MSLDTPDEPLDPRDHPAYNKPDATQHYAGDVLPFPISQQSSETHRAVDLGMRESIGLGSKAPAGRPSAKILKGPGAN